MKGAEDDHGSEGSEYGLMESMGGTEKVVRRGQRITCAEQVFLSFFL